MSDWNDLPDPCYYCGLPADTIDHVVPQSILKAVHDSGEEALYSAIYERGRRLTVPACRECNSLAGAKYHHTLAERLAYVQAGLRRRYQQTLSIPDWSDSELMQLSPMLRNRVISTIMARDLVRRRLGYHRGGFHD